MQGSTGGCPQSFRRKRVCGSADTGSSGGGAGRSKGGSGAENGPDVAGILNAGQDDQQRSASRKGSSDKVIERCLTRFNKRRDALGVFGIGETLEEAVGSAKSGKGDFRPVDQGSEAFTVAFAGFPEKNGADRTTGMQSFFN